MRTYLIAIIAIFLLIGMIGYNIINTHIYITKLEIEQSGLRNDYHQLLAELYDYSIAVTSLSGKTIAMIDTVYEFETYLGLSHVNEYIDRTRYKDCRIGIGGE